MIDQVNKNVYGNELKYVYGMNQMDTGMLPMHFPAEAIPPADSSLTSLPILRKRSRDLCNYSFDQPSVFTFPNDQFVNHVNQTQLNNNNNNNNININPKGIFTFLGNDISMQIYEQQAEIDRFISQHMEKMRSEIEVSRRRITMRLIEAAEEGMKRLRLKEDEIVKIGRLNRALEEKVKSLDVDNQIWQQMAQTNEAAANVLRKNLQQIVTEIQQQQQNQFQAGVGGGTVDDVESCCGSNYDDENCKQLMLEKGNDADAYCRKTDGGDNNNGGRVNRWWCRNCGKEEMCSVLLLPCRHLCVCTVCESSINVCPICKSTKNASVHVNMNSF